METTITSDDVLTGIELTVSRDTIGETAAATQVTVTATLKGNVGDVALPEATEVTLVLDVTACTAQEDTFVAAQLDDDYTMTGLEDIDIDAGDECGTVTLTIDPAGADLVEGDETVTLKGTLPATLDPAPAQTSDTATITLTDETNLEGGVPSANASITGPNAAVTESQSAEFTIELSHDVASDITVSWTASGTATAGKDTEDGDYTVPADDGTSSVLFTAGDKKRTVTVTATDESLSEVTATLEGPPEPRT